MTTDKMKTVGLFATRNKSAGMQTGSNHHTNDILNLDTDKKNQSQSTTEELAGNLQW